MRAEQLRFAHDVSPKLVGRHCRFGMLNDAHIVGNTADSGCVLVHIPNASELNRSRNGRYLTVKQSQDWLTSMRLWRQASSLDYQRMHLEPYIRRGRCLWAIVLVSKNGAFSLRQTPLSVGEQRYPDRAAALLNKRPEPAASRKLTLTPAAVIG